MIDKNGKLFGKINIIDLLVLLVIMVAVLIFGGKKLMDRKTAAENAPETFTMEFYTDEVYDYVTEHVKVGETIFDADKDVVMGKVTSFEVGPSKVYYPDSQGKVVVSEKEGFSSITIKGEMTGKLGDLGAVIDGETYGVGHTFTVRVGKAKIYLKVSDIN